MIKFPVYLDYAATSPADPRVAEKMMTCLTRDGLFGNAASKSHSYGWQAAEAVAVILCAFAPCVRRSDFRTRQRKGGKGK